MGLPFILAYLMECLAEEGLFRYIIIEFVHDYRGVLLSAVLYALAHFILFNWIVVLLCFPLGLALGVIFLNMRKPWGYIVCVAVHYAVGGIVSLLGWF